MQDGIIKGTGDSRYLKSVEDFQSRYPAYEDFVAALVAGTLPVDLNGINEAGWTQLPTWLSKANLLRDTTAAMYGYGNDAVIDDVFYTINLLLTSIDDTNVVMMRVVDEDGSPADHVAIAYGDVEVITEEKGIALFSVPANTSCDFTITYPLGYVSASGANSESVTVTSGNSGLLPKTVTCKKSTETLRTIPTSGRVLVSNRVADLEAYALGGGGGGGGQSDGTGYRYETAIGIGGAGGYTNTGTIDLSNDHNKILNMVVGAGGQGGDDAAGSAGGTTSISNQASEVLITADGGEGGGVKSGGSSNGDSKAGASGGSGSGGCYVNSSSSTAAATVYCAPGGSDGSNGGTAYNTTPGTGQGRTTKPFGDANWPGNFGNAGGSAGYGFAGSANWETSDGGDGAGDGRYAVDSTSSNSRIYGYSATEFGCGGGGTAVQYTVSSYAAHGVGGNGYQGVIMLRWGYAA